MEDTYYFSQGRLISATPYNKFKDKDNIVNDNVNNNEKDSLLYKLLNFQIYKKSILRYNLY
jgi:hypothetical protein